MEASVDAHRVMSDDEILAWLRNEYAKPFLGWDFSYLQGRRHTIGDKPGDFETIVRERLSKATTVLTWILATAANSPTF